MSRVTVATGAETHQAQTWIKIPKAADNVNRAVKVVVGRFLVQCTAGANGEGDGMASADTTGSASRKILGLVFKVTDINGAPLDNAILNTDEEGGVLIVPVTDTTFRAFEDGDGGNISDANQFAYVAMLKGTETRTSTRNSNYTPNPQPNDVIDSSSVGSGTASNRAFQLQGADPHPLNALPGAKRSFLFKVNSGWIA